MMVTVVDLFVFFFFENLVCISVATLECASLLFFVFVCLKIW